MGATILRNIFKGGEPNASQIRVGDIVSGSNLAENFKDQTLTAVGFAHGSDVPMCVLRSHESTCPQKRKSCDRSDLSYPIGKEWYTRVEYPALNT